MGMTAVQLAYFHGRSDCVKKLIEHSADELSLEGLKFGASKETNSLSSLNVCKEL